MSANAIAALDFDGVLCNSARETAISAWRAGRAFWSEWDALNPPADYVDRFVQVRPYLETGYQAIVMMRMVVDGLEEKEFREHLITWCDRWVERLGTSRQGLVEQFGAARDRWIQEDETSWLASHDFYDGVIRRLKSITESMSVYILTTKQERFVHALLESQGISLDENRVFGLEAGLKKEEILKRFLQEAPSRSVHFVEDRAATLRRVLDEPALHDVCLYYASWGYGTESDRQWAADHPRVTKWALDEFGSFKGK